MTRDTPPDQAAPRRSVAWYAGAMAFYLVVFGTVQFSVSEFPGVDAYYHVKVTQLMGRVDLAPEFKWTAESSWAEHYSDKEWAYHAYLWPFVRLGESTGRVVPAVKAAVVLLDALLMLVILIILVRFGVPGPFWWSGLVLGAGWPFLFRMSYVRPQVVAVLLLIGGLGLVLARRHKLLFLLALVFPVAHTSFHALPIMILLVVLGSVLLRRTWSYVPLLVVLVGIAIGCRAHPHWPDNLPHWYAQNVVQHQVRLADDTLGADDFGGEFKPVVASVLLRTDGVVLALWFAVVCLGLQGVRASDDTVSMMMVAGAFGVMTLLSNRFIEYWAPLTVMAAAFYARDGLASGMWSAVVSRWSRLRVGAGVILLLLIGTSVSGAIRIFGAKQRYEVVEISEWLRDNTPENDRVFHPAFDQFPKLFYHNDHNVYIAALDPIFFYARDADRCRAWHDIAHGRAEDPARRIREDFRCRWAVVDTKPRHRTLLDQLKNDPSVKRVKREGKGAGAVYLFDLSPDR